MNAEQVASGKGQGASGDCQITHIELICAGCQDRLHARGGDALSAIALVLERWHWAVAKVGQLRVFCYTCTQERGLERVKGQDLSVVYAAGSNHEGTAVGAGQEGLGVAKSTQGLTPLPVAAHTPPPTPPQTSPADHVHALLQSGPTVDEQRAYIQAGLSGDVLASGADLTPGASPAPERHAGVRDSGSFVESATGAAGLPAADVQLAAAKKAIAHVLQQIRDNPKVQYEMGFLTQGFELLTEAAALLWGKDKTRIQAYYLGETDEVP